MQRPPDLRFRPLRRLGLLVLTAVLCAGFAPQVGADKGPVIPPTELKARDLKLVASAGTGYLVFTPSELLEHPLLRQFPARFRESIQALERELPSKLGISPRHLQRVILIFPTGSMSEPVVVLTSTTEFDQPAAEKLLGDVKVARLREYPAWHFPGRREVMVHYDNSTILFGQPRDLDAFLERVRVNRIDPALARGLSGAEGGAHVVVGVRPDDLVAMFALRQAPRVEMKKTDTMKKEGVAPPGSGPGPGGPPGPMLPPGFGPGPGGLPGPMLPPGGGLFPGPGPNRGLVVADDPPPVVEREPLPTMTEILREMPASALPYKPLLLCKSATLTVRFGEDTASVGVDLNYAKPEQAEDGLNAAKTSLYVLREALPMWWREEIGFDPRSAVEVVRALDRINDGLRAGVAKVAGNSVEVRLSLPLEPTILGGILRDAEIGLPGNAERKNNLKQIGLAMHNYHDANGAFPGMAYYTQAGKPLLSWRVAILPYIEQEALFREFRLDEPWDSAHNIKLLAKMPPVFAPPAGVKTEPGHTFLQGFSGAGTMFDPQADQKQPMACRGLRLTTVTDGTSNTAMIGESGRAVPWTKPDDIPADGRMVPPLGSVPGSDRCHVLMADGAVFAIATKPPLELFQRMVGRQDGMVFDIRDLQPGRPQN